MKSVATHTDITCNILSSFVKGARNSQCDWFFKVEIPKTIGGLCSSGHLFVFGDGHGEEWTPSFSSSIEQYFLNSLDELSDESEFKTNSQLLDYLYHSVTQKFITDYFYVSAGSSIICCLITTDDCAILIRGDSEIVLEQSDHDLEYIPSFDWSLPLSVELASQIGKVVCKPFLKMKKRLDALAWEERFHPLFMGSSTSPLPETIGLIGGQEIGFTGINNATRRQIMELCCGTWSGNAKLRCMAASYPRCTEGLTITMASDGIRSKGCMPLTETLKYYVNILNKLDTTPCKLITSSPDCILVRQLVPINPSSNPFKLNVLKRDYNNSTGLLSSPTRFLEVMSEADSLEMLKISYDLWLPLVTDAEWKEAIDESFSYFSKTPTLADAENPLEFLNRMCVLNLSDDNTSTVRITIGLNSRSS